MICIFGSCGSDLDASQIDGLDSDRTKLLANTACIEVELEDPDNIAITAPPLHQDFDGVARVSTLAWCAWVLSATSLQDPGDSGGRT